MDKHSLSFYRKEKKNKKTLTFARLILSFFLSFFSTKRNKSTNISLCNIFLFLFYSFLKIDSITRKKFFLRWTWKWMTSIPIRMMKIHSKCTRFQSLHDETPDEGWWQPTISLYLGVSPSFIQIGQISALYVQRE